MIHGIQRQRNEIDLSTTDILKYVIQLISDQESVKKYISHDNQCKQYHATLESVNIGDSLKNTRR